MNVGSLLARHARFRPDHLAVVCGARRLTFADHYAAVNRLSNALLGLGLEKGDKVAIILPNCVELLESYRACAQLGLVSVPLSPLLRGPGLVTLLRDSETSAVIAGAAMIDALSEARTQLPSIDAANYILVGAPHARGYRDYAAFTGAASDEPPPAVDIRDDDIYNIIYSSGTTGDPKGIVHTHYVRALYCTMFASQFRFTPESVVMHAGSLVFNGAFVTMMPAWFLGCTFVLQEKFDPAGFIDAVEREGVTHVMMVPSQIVAVIHAANFSGTKLQSLRMLCSVGAPWHREHKEKLLPLLPDSLYELYGLTEGFITVLDSKDFARKIDSVGTPIAFSEMRIVGDDGRDLATGEVGEIVGRSPLMMPGYYKRPDLTAQAIKDGWLFSGDVGMADAEGFLHLVDRKKDMIISGGVNVFPKDIEEVAVQHEAVREVAVFGIPNDKWGESPFAAVVLKSGQSVTGDELRTWINARVSARYQQVCDVVLVDDLPRSTAGKTLKRVLREQYANRATTNNRERATKPVDGFVSARGVKIHYIDTPGGSTPIVMLHGLSANARCFAGLIAAGLSPTFRVVAPDLRGRGKTDKPTTGYTMADHASDVLALLDALGLERVMLAGHSFGGYVAIYLASKFPERVEKLIVIDAAITLNPRVGELLKPSLDRLTRISPSVDAYLSEARDAPHLAGFWDDHIEQYFRAEIQENADGTAQSATSASAIGQAMVGLRSEPWLELVKSVKHPVLFLNAVGAYGPPGTPALVEPEYARATADAFPNVRYAVVPGNHMTMVFGPGAVAVNREIERFVLGSVQLGSDSNSPSNWSLTPIAPGDETPK